MRVAVLGAGVVGVTTAYYLAERGHDVTVIERATEPASATSHANGSQLSYSYTEPFAQPSMLMRMPSVLLGRDPAIRVRLLGNPALIGWGQAFARQCTAGRARDTMLDILDLAMRSAALLERLREDLSLPFHWRRAGKLVVLDTADEVAAAVARAALKQERGCNVRVVGADEAIALEPALARMHQEFAAAVYSPDDEVGDARAFTVGLAHRLVRDRGVCLRLGEPVESLVVRSGRLVAIRTLADELPVDAAVVCLGPWSRALLHVHRIRLPICPIRGYSVTLPAGDSAPSISVTNVARRIVYSLLGEQVRIAGFADFVGLDTTADDERIRQLVQTAREVAPEAADYSVSERQAWGGFRPATPSSRPVVGRTHIGGLYLNTGHGTLGWTLACATAADVAEQVG